ncbi:MAG: MFS transporter [Gemmataceae bacterium]|nr:MFS transporter [Gemmataceae bacterium]
MFLFWASFITLIAAGMGFAIRGDIIANWGKDFGFTQTELGELTGMGLAGFGVAIIFFSFFTDLFGYGKLMVVAFLLHLAAVLTTLAAPYIFQSSGKSGAYWCLFVGQFLFSLANGTCEAVINPLTATLFPRNKTHWLNILHAGWPGGLVLGALVSLVLNQVAGGVGWQVRWGIVLLPVLLYGGLMLGRRFPMSEAKASGVSVGTMAATLFTPILLFLFLMHALVGYVELGTDSWIVDITKTVLQNSDKAQIAFIWTNVMMFTLRFFAGPIVHRINPVGLLFLSAVFGTAGLWLLGQNFTDSTWPWMAAVTVYGLGKTFYWPTLLGVISERFPRGGALALGVSGGIGMISAGLLGGPGIGFEQDLYASRNLQQVAPETYARYKADKENTFPIPGIFPPAVGLDGAKKGVLMDDGKQLAEDLATMKAAGKTDENLEKLNAWWQGAKPYAAEDKKYVAEANTVGGKSALADTALVPAALAVGFLLLLVYFAATGGYKQVHLEEEPPMAEY